MDPGVNLDRYPFREINVNSQEVKFVIVARLIKEKGIQLFMDTAKTLKKQFPLSEFHIIGGVGNSPSSVKIEALNTLHESGIIIFHGPKYNIPNILKDMHIFVLPTFYREGIPRSILEALSIGMPIITTNTPGCKETVVENENGFLIPPNSLAPLIEACKFFIENPSKINQMGKRSRQLAEEKFDVNIINKQLVNDIKTVLHN